MGQSFSSPASMSDVLTKSDFPSGAKFRLSDLGEMTPGITNPCKLSDFADKKRIFGDSRPYGYVDGQYVGFDMTGTMEIVQGTHVANDNLNSIKIMSIRAVVTFDENDYGIIFESGGAGAGCALYIDSKTLYWQCGDGGSAGGEFELSYDISGLAEEPREIVMYVNIDNGQKQGTLKVNGTQVDSVASTTSNVPSAISGTNAGGSGAKYSAIPVLHNNQASNFTGTIHTVRIYNE